MKAKLFEEIRKNAGMYKSNTDAELNNIFFCPVSTLRLTLTGFVALKSMFTVYSFELTNNLTAKHKIGLSNMRLPYYLTKNRLIIFSTSDAVLIKLMGGIKQYLEYLLKDTKG